MLFEYIILSAQLASTVRSIHQFLPLPSEPAVSNVFAVGLNRIMIPTTRIRQHPGVDLKLGLHGLRRTPSLVQEGPGAHNRPVYASTAPTEELAVARKISGAHETTTACNRHPCSRQQ
jgi:hypothetical protein